MKFNGFFLFSAVFFLTLNVNLYAQKGGAPSHEAFNTLLTTHVDANGTVNYAGFKENVAELDAYLKTLSKNPVQSSWSKEEAMSYWINAYNAFTIKLILDNYPVKSIKDLHEGKPWDVKWIKLGKSTYSLNNIENDILRPKYKDARIHFALNCAAESCPPLLNKAWTAENLNDELRKRTFAFVRNKKFNQISNSSAKLSQIFNWYMGDFGNLIGFINKYSKSKVGMDTNISFNEYSWKLNGK